MNVSTFKNYLLLEEYFNQCIPNIDNNNNTISDNNRIIDLNIELGEIKKYITLEITIKL